MNKLKHGWNAFRPYAQGDLGHVWANLREDDQLELSTVGFDDPAVIEQVLLQGNAKLTTWDTDEGPVAVLGVTQTENPAAGLVWALAAKEAQPRWRFAVRNTQSVLDKLGEDYLVLYNFKDSRNINQINWLKKVGFTFINRLKGEDGVTYLEFVRITK